MYDVLMVEQEALFGEQPPMDGFRAQVLTRWRSVRLSPGSPATVASLTPPIAPGVVWHLSSSMTGPSLVMLIDAETSRQCCCSRGIAAGRLPICWTQNY